MIRKFLSYTKGIIWILSCELEHAQVAGEITLILGTKHYVDNWKHVEFELNLEENTDQLITTYNSLRFTTENHLL